MESALRETPGLVYAKDGVHPAAEVHAFIATEVCSDLWKTLALPGKTVTARGEPLRILRQRADTLKLAWLTHTRHTRPGVPMGLPMPEAEKQAAARLADYQCARLTTPPNTKR